MTGAGDTVKLIAMVRDGDVAGVLGELGALTPAEREQCRTALAARRAAMADTNWHAAPDDEWRDERIAQLTAELGCQDDLRAATAWLTLEENRGPLRGLGWRRRWLLDVVNLWPAAWRTELVTALTGSIDAQREIFLSGLFIEHLVHDTGCAPPTCTAFLTCWISDRFNPGDRPAHLPDGPSGDGVAQRLRNDPFTPILLPAALRDIGVFLRPERLMELLEVGVISRVDLAVRCFAVLASGPSHGWFEWLDVLRLVATDPDAGAVVAEQRGVVFDRGVAELFENHPIRFQRDCVTFLRALSLTRTEHLARVRDHLAMLDGDCTAAAFAQETLAGLDMAGLIEPELLTEVSARVLRRPEKKLVGAQLSWLDRAARRDRARAAQVVLAAAVAFEHPDPGLQERALSTVARHLQHAGISVLPALRTAAERLNPALSAQAGELLGTPPEKPPASPTDTLSFVYAPGPVPAPIATAAEVTEEVAAVIAGDQSVVAFERALDGLVRHAHLDPAGLAEALRPVTQSDPEYDWGYGACVPADLCEVAFAAAGQQPHGRSIRTRRRWSSFSCASELLAARIEEATGVVRSRELPFLLATPTVATGALDAAVLVERVAAYERLGVVPGPYDLAQALLRVTPTTDEQVLSAAGTLDCEAGRQVATWLRAGGLPHQRSEPERWKRRGEAKPYLQEPVASALQSPCPLPPHAMNLLTAKWYPSPIFHGAVWAAQLPHHRDEFAAHMHGSTTEKGGGRTLAALARCDGPAGYALHMTMAEGLRLSATELPQDHLAVVEAVLTMAARGHLDSAILGRQLAIMTCSYWSNRSVASLRAIAETGAYVTVYSILRAMLPGILGAEPVRGAGELVALAAECAVRCRATGEIPEVTAVAERKGSSDLVKWARILRDTLCQNADFIQQ